MEAQCLGVDWLVIRRSDPTWDARETGDYCCEDL